MNYLRGYYRAATDKSKGTKEITQNVQQNAVFIYLHIENNQADM